MIQYCINCDKSIIRDTKECRSCILEIQNRNKSLIKKQQLEEKKIIIKGRFM